MRHLAFFVLLSLSPGLFAQEAIPTGTILPVQLNSTLKSDHAKPGQVLTTRIMQDVPLPGGSKIRAGAKVIGHVVAARPETNSRPAEVVLRFDTLAVGQRRIPVTTSLRALAGMMEVAEAQVPKTGPDRGTSEHDWNTVQIGGEVNYHDAVLADGLHTVGRSVADGVLARPTAPVGSKCRDDIEPDDQPQALWLFSSYACGLYGFSDLTLIHAGRTDPVGEITISSRTGKVNVPAGSGMLLRVK
jgi:hypothetical protein